MDPQPAKSNQYEIGVRQQGGALDYSAAAFYTYSDLISALDCSDPKVPCQPLREPRKFWGIEGTLGWRINARWRVGANLSWMEGIRTLDSGEQRRIGGSQVPPLLLSAHLDYAPSADWTHRIELDYRASRDRFGASTKFDEGAVDSLLLAHLLTSVKLGKGELRIGVRNLFDKRHYAVVPQAYNRGFNWIPNQGRRASISYETKW